MNAHLYFSSSELIRSTNEPKDVNDLLKNYKNYHCSYYNVQHKSLYF